MSEMKEHLISKLQSEYSFGLSGANFPLLGCQAVENMPLNIVKT